MQEYKGDYRILLKSLKLQDFRCFGTLEVSFDEKLTVFIAENGGGKTALLDAIALCLKKYLADLKVEGYQKSEDTIREKDIKKIKNQQYGNYAKAELTADVRYSFDASYFDEKEDDWVYQWDDRDATVLLTATTSSKERVHDKSTIEFLDTALPMWEAATNPPVLVYYGGDSVKIIPQTEKEPITDSLAIIYQQALSSERFHFSTFYHWYKEKEDKLLRMDKEVNKFDIATIENTFNAIKNALEYVFNEEGSEPIYTDFRIDQYLEMGMKKLQPDGDRLFIDISLFSSGEKVLFAFVVDLAIRLLEANPLNETTEALGKNTIRGRGIVLIDEIDLHLHPKWQRTVLKKLQDVFPDVQFVISTHSPLVLQNANGRVHKIGKGELESKFGGWEISEILKFMGVEDNGEYSDDFNKAYKEFNKAYSKSDYEEANKQYKILKELLPKGSDITASLKIQLDSLEDNLI